MKLICFMCEEEFDELGALVFSPPLVELAETTTVEKFHVCPECWKHLEDYLHDSPLDRKVTDESLHKKGSEEGNQR